MNFFILKDIIHTALDSYICKECGAKLSDKSVNIEAVDGNKVELSSDCPRCNAHLQVHLEVGELKQMIARSHGAQENHFIGPEDIQSVAQIVQEKQSVEELFNSEI